MDKALQDKCDLIIENRNILYKQMKWEIASNDVAIMGALLTSSKDKKADEEIYRSCKKKVKQTVSVLNEFRGISATMVITKMTLCEDEQTFLDGSLEVYKRLRKIHKLTASPFMVMAAITIFENGGIENADENIKRLEELYAGLKKNHPFLISDSDRGYLAMMIASKLDTDKLIAEVETCYQACTGVSTFNKDSVHSMAQVLALSSKSSDKKAEEVNEMLRLLKEKKHRINKSNGLSVVAAMVLLDMPIEEKVNKIIDVADYLKDKKGFKWYNMDSYTRVMYAALIVFMTYSSEVEKEIADSIGSNLTMVIVEELIILMIILIASAQASVATNNSSN